MCQRFAGGGGFFGYYINLPHLYGDIDDIMDLNSLAADLYPERSN